MSSLPPVEALPSLPWPVALLGTGRLGEALLEGLARAGLLSAGRVVPTARRPERLAALSTRWGIPVTHDNREALRGARLVLLGVRPVQLPALLEEVALSLTPGQCVVSLAAGVPLSQLAAQLPPGVSLVRAVPNLPMAVGSGVTAVAAGARTQPEDVADVLHLFATVGQAFPVEERHLDVIHALSGAGPAYVYKVVEALAEAARQQGLPEGLALALATGATLGAARMASTLRLPPAALVARATGPGEPTAAGLAALEAHGLPEALGAAVSATARALRAGTRLLPAAAVPDGE